MSCTAPDGRQVYNPRGRDPTEDLNLLADAIAGSPADLFAQGSQIMWLKDTGELVGASRDVLLEIITKYIVTKHLVSHGDRWQVEYHPYVPNEMTLRALLKEDGGLAQRLPRVPGEPVRLSPQRQQEVLARLKMGERADRVAAAYGVDVAVVERLAR
jgi:hypothetical protein